MTNNLSDPNQLQSEIAAIMAERIQNPSDFEPFAKQMLRLGIDRLIYEGIKDEMIFYTNDRHVHTQVMSNIADAKHKDQWKLGQILDESKLEKAIKELDAGNISSIEFHHRIFASGVVLVNVYLAPRKIYYMGIDGQYFLENY